jgi:hypothetical protein
VGTTERFDEFLLLLSDLAGLQRPAYRMQTVGTHTLARQLLQRGWTNRSCTTLLAAPPAELLSLIAKRLEASARGKKSGEPMECRTYGPCVAPGLSPAKRTQRNAPFERDTCARVSPHQVLARLCQGLEMDERIYLSARRRFDAQLAALGQGLDSRVPALRAANAELARRADAQAAQPVASLEAASGVALQQQYVQGNWRVDERAAWYVQRRLLSHRRHQHPQVHAPQLRAAPPC